MSLAHGMFHKWDHVVIIITHSFFLKMNRILSIKNPELGPGRSLRTINKHNKSYRPDTPPRILSATGNACNVQWAESLDLGENSGKENVTCAYFHLPQVVNCPGTKQIQQIHKYKREKSKHNTEENHQIIRKVT